MRDGASVMIVDDEPGVRWIVREMLERDGWRVTEAVDGADALVQFRPGAFGLVLMDLHMPRLDGLSALRALRRADPDVAVVLTSGAAPPDVCEQLRAIGHAAFLCKPFHRGDLLRAIARVATVGEACESVSG